MLLKEICNQRFKFFWDINQTKYNYDVLGNIRTIVFPTKTLSYHLDYDDLRVSKRDGTTILEFYAWNRDQRLVAKISNTGQVVARYIYGSRYYVPDYMEVGANKYQIITDHLGSPVVVVNTATGVVAQEVKYDEFGNIISDTNPGFTPFGFAGCLYDQDTKLCRFGARDYDASIGRWLSKDPILFGGGDTNLYGYVMQDPVNFIDPNGRSRVGVGLDFGGGIMAETSGGAIGSIIGGVGGAMVGGLPGSIAGGLAGEFIGDTLNGPSLDSDADNPRHPKFAPFNPLPPEMIPSHTPPLPKRPTRNSCGI